jgi:hypothetical protein
VDSVSLIEQLQALYKDRVACYVVYTREVHPRKEVPDPQTFAERQQLARDTARDLKVAVPFLVDTIDDHTARAYASGQTRCYVIDARGKVAYRSAPGLQGFTGAELPAVLDRLLGVKLAGRFRPRAESWTISVPTPGAGDPSASVEDQARAVLGPLGFDEKMLTVVVPATAKRVAAFREVTKARARLLKATKGEEDALLRALGAFAQAQKRYRRTVQKTDQDLETALHVGGRPRLRLVGTGLGLLGTFPARPLGGLEQRPGDPLADGAGPPASTRDQARAVLGRLGFWKESLQPVTVAAAKRAAAYQELTEARTRLLEALRTPADQVGGPLTAFQDAQRRYEQAVTKADRELDAAVHCSRRPRLRALLTALDLLGNSPGPPLNGAVVLSDESRVPGDPPGAAPAGGKGPDAGPRGH